MDNECHSMCPVCGNNDLTNKYYPKSWMYHNKFVRPEYVYIKCPKCGAFYREQKIIDYSILYDEDYPSLSLNIVDHNNLHGNIRAKLSRLRDQYAYMNSNNLFGCLLDKIIPAPYPLLTWFGRDFLNGKKVIDIGCGIGQAMYTLRNIGVNAHGAEPYLAEDIHYDNGLIVEKKFISEINEKYDIVYSSNVFEHISNPLEYLVDAKRILNDGGVIAMEFPALGSLFDIYYENYYAIQAPQHEILHTRESVGYLAEKTGLRVERFMSKSYYSWYLKSHLLSLDMNIKDNYSLKKLKSFLNNDELNEVNRLWKQTNKWTAGDYYYVVLMPDKE